MNYSPYKVAISKNKLVIQGRLCRLCLTPKLYKQKIRKTTTNNSVIKRKDIREKLKIQWNHGFSNPRLPEPPDISNQTSFPLDLLHLSSIISNFADDAHLDNLHKSTGNISQIIDQSFSATS